MRTSRCLTINNRSKRPLPFQLMNGFFCDSYCLSLVVPCRIVPSNEQKKGMPEKFGLFNFEPAFCSSSNQVPVMNAVHITKLVVVLLVLLMRIKLSNREKDCFFFLCSTEKKSFDPNEKNGERSSLPLCLSRISADKIFISLTLWHNF